VLYNNTHTTNHSTLGFRNLFENKKLHKRRVSRVMHVDRGDWTLWTIVWFFSAVMIQSFCGALRLWPVTQMIFPPMCFLSVP
jgi:hypothetical protein